MRGVSGSLSVGAVVVAVVLIGAQLWANARGLYGPGLLAVTMQAVVALVAMALQFIADRREGGPATGTSLGVVALVLGSVWFWWW